MHRYRHNAKAITYGERGWQPAADAGLLGIEYRHLGDNRLQSQTDHVFVNLISCSYLGLDVDPRLTQGAIKAIETCGTLIMGSSRLRIKPEILARTEAELSELFNAPVLTNVSCGVTACGVLPLISSGHLTGSEPVTTVFDQHAHFTMHVAKPICADEATVLTCPHNDMNYLEDACKHHPRVAYVCDGIYSMGDQLPLEDLLALQDRYGLFLYVDDSHGLSVYGEHGEGFVKARLGPLNPLTMVVASLWKGFGARGSVLMFGAEDKRPIMERYGGGTAWSQYLTTADCGAILASAAIHRTPELQQRQQQLQENIKLLDALLPNEQCGSDFPIRVLRFGDEATAVERSRQLFDAGYYASSVCFPVVARGQAGLRVMMRSNLTDNEVHGFAQALHQTMPAGWKQ